MEKSIDDLYEILDDMNARIEDIVNEYSNSDELDIVISKLNQKAQEFIYDFQQEIEQIARGPIVKAPARRVGGKGGEGEGGHAHLP